MVRENRTSERPLAVYVTPKLRERVKAYAERQAVSVSTVAMFALTEYLDAHEASQPRGRKRRKA